MTAPVAVTIGGAAVTTLDQSEFRIDSILGQTIDTATLKIYDKTNAIALPEQADVVITRTDTGERIFGGLSSIPIGWTEGASRWWQLSCQDYTTLLDSTIVFASYPSGFTYDGLVGDKAVIANLFEMAVVGIGGGTAPASEINARTYVEQGLTSMAALFFQYTTLREALQTITSYTGRNYYVDYDLKLHYYYKMNEPASFSLSSSADGVSSLSYRSLKWQRDGTSIRNLYMAFGANLFSSLQTYILPNSGGSTAITLGVTALGRNVILAAPAGEDFIKVYKNTGTDLSPVWTQLTVGLENLDSLTDKDVLHNPTEQRLTFAVAPPNFTNSVKIEAVFAFIGGQPDADIGSITKYGRVFAKRIVAGDANSAAALNAKVQNYKKQFAYALNKATLTVDDSSFPVGDTRRFKCGQWVNLTNDILSQGFTNPPLQAKGFIIHRMTTKILGGDLLSYELELRDWFTDSTT